MRAAVIAPEPDFGGVLCALVESIPGCRTLWYSTWPEPDPDQAQLVLAHLTDTAGISLAEKYLQGLIRAGQRQAVILVGDNVPVESRIRLLELGAMDCLERPVNLQRIRYLVDALSLRVSAHRQRRSRAPSAAASPSSAGDLEEMIGKLSRVSTNLLLTGESGSGKTWLARQIHRNSERCKHPFVTINCAAIPDSLLESELYGHKKGSFTGADSCKTGRFAFAGKGTVLLDEIDALPPGVQAKLLHAVEEREFQPVGSNETVSFAARIIAASNRNLETLVEQGRFRADLFFRLDVFEYMVPPLRERVGEIDRLLQVFCDDYARENNCPRPRFAGDVIGLFHEYPWPGNLRELRNCVEHSSINCQGNTVERKDLPPRMLRFFDQAASRESAGETSAAPPFPGSGGAPVAAGAAAKSAGQFDLMRSRDETGRLLRVLEQHNFNRTRAARELGISRTAMYKKLNRFHLA